ncbi:hypothetical protein [Mucilaginibacter sp.]|uniref:hypothetical protein n=1 Tax=Mucilaginibacter sp. TaxID=1882438 RepID=UPI003D134423
MKTLGIMLILLGAGMLSFNGCSSRSNKVMNDNGTIQTTAAPVQESSLKWFPYAGAVVFVTGIFVTTRRSKNN